MIDWFNLGAKAQWVIGCAVVLATLNYASGEASLFRQRLPNGSNSTPHCSLSIWARHSLGGEWWWIGLWGLTGLAFLFQVVLILRAG